MKHHEFFFEVFTEEVKGQDHRLRVVLHPKEELYLFTVGMH